MNRANQTPEKQQSKQNAKDLHKTVNHAVGTQNIKKAVAKSKPNKKTDHKKHPVTKAYTDKVFEVAENVVD